MIKKLKPCFRKCFDALYLGIPKWYHRAVLKSYAKHPGKTLPSRFQVFPQMFYSPLLDPGELNLELLGKKRELPGVRIDMEEVMPWVDKVAAHAAEFDTWAERDPATGRVTWAESFTTIDSVFLYGLLRHIKPKRYIEVGCGTSSWVSSKAIRRNHGEGVGCRASFIEPYPGRYIEDYELAGELIVENIQDVPMELFQELEAGDVFFIDTSHILKAQSDVEWELLHILPMLKKGVIIHLHDIYTPYEQPKDWLLDRYLPRYSNEQYAMECLLSGGSEFRTLLPLYLLGVEKKEQLSGFIPKGLDRGQSYWIEKC